MSFYRFPWGQFPDVVIHADELKTRSHSEYRAAKTGDSNAAYRLVHDLLNSDVLAAIEETSGPIKPVLVSAHAFESGGVNAIPVAPAEMLSAELGWDVEHEVFQTNIVSHTRADGFSRLGRQAEFGGTVDGGRRYFLVDDFVGQGGTLANLRGWVIKQGAVVIGATVLTGKSFSAKLPVEQKQIDELSEKHGEDLKRWWIARYRFGYECLTFSEGRYLIKTPSADKIRNRIAAAGES